MYIRYNNNMMMMMMTTRWHWLCWKIKFTSVCKGWNQFHSFLRCWTSSRDCHHHIWLSKHKGPLQLLSCKLIATIQHHELVHTVYVYVLSRWASLGCLWLMTTYSGLESANLWVITQQPSKSHTTTWNNNIKKVIKIIFLQSDIDEHCVMEKSS